MNPRLTARKDYIVKRPCLKKTGRGMGERIGRVMQWYCRRLLFVIFVVVSLDFNS